MPDLRDEAPEHHVGWLDTIRVNSVKGTLTGRVSSVNPIETDSGYAFTILCVPDWPAESPAAESVHPVPPVAPVQRQWAVRHPGGPVTAWGMVLDDSRTPELTRSMAEGELHMASGLCWACDGGDHALVVRDVTSWQEVAAVQDKEAGDDGH